MESKVNTSLDNNMLIASSSPHIRSKETVNRIMLDVIIALMPALIFSVINFGIKALILVVVSVVSAVVFEFLAQKMFKKEVTIRDLSAVVTGILLAFNMPAGAPLWMAVFGSAFAIIIVKQFFGGLGQNFMNPALAARAALMASWPTLMTTFPRPGMDTMTTATPLGMMETGASLPSLADMFIGRIGGTIGEVSALCLIIGGVYLIYRGVINWRIPVTYIATTAIVLFALGLSPELVVYHILSGGLILGAFFMATDYASGPASSKGQVVFAIGAGLLTAIIRTKGGFPEGVSYSILLMNVLTPLIEKFTAPRVFGRSK